MRAAKGPRCRSRTPAGGSPSGSWTPFSRWPTGVTPPAHRATAAVASAWPWPGAWSRPTTARSPSTTRARAAVSPSGCPSTGPDAVRVLVTGGAGFIGSHIVDALLDGGAHVRVVDSLEPSVHAGSRDGSDPRAELLVGDLGDPAVAAAAVDGVDAVCHQAAKVGLGVDFGDVTGYVAGNDTATAVLLEALWRNGFGGRLVLASSMVVYGDGLARCGVHGPVAPAARLA